MIPYIVQSKVKLVFPLIDIQNGLIFEELWYDSMR